MSIHFLLFAGTTPVGGFLLGYLSEHYGTRTAVATLALLTAAGIAAALTYRRTHASAFREPIPTAAGPVTAAATPVLSTATASEVSAAAPSSRLRS